MSTLAESGIAGTVACCHCESPLHLACPKCGPGAEYHIKPLREKRAPAEKNIPGFSRSPCVSCKGAVELTGNGRPHQQCLTCRGLAP